MGWLQCLAVALLSGELVAKTPSQLSLSPIVASSELDTAQVGKSDVLETTAHLPSSTHKRVTTTIGSFLPPNPELVVNFPTEVEYREDKRRELDLLKRSSKFRNAALGSATVKVKQDESQIQNTEGENSQLPPFAFSEDEGPNKRSAASPRTPAPPVSTTSRPEVEGDANTFAEINRAVAQDEQAQRTQVKRNFEIAAPDETKSFQPLNHPLETDSDLTDTVIESGRTHGPTEDEVFTTIAEYNRWIAEKAAKRRQIKEEGYKKYSQISFKSGRNIVPVRLFFDTDPIIPPLKSRTDDFAAKRSIAGMSNSHEAKTVEQNAKVPIVDDNVNRDKVPAKGLNEPETFINTGSTGEKIAVSQPAQPVGAEPRRNETESTEDGSGMPTTAANGEPPEELLVADKNETSTSASAENSTVGDPATWSPGSTSAQLEPLPDDVSNVESISAPERPPPVATAQLKGKDASESESARQELVVMGSSTSTTATPSTLAMTPSKSGPVPGNSTNTLPPLLSMPSLNSLSSFSSLNTPVDIATHPQPNKVVSQEKKDNRKKTSGRIKSRPLVNNQKRKHSLNRGRQQFEVVDSDDKQTRRPGKGRVPTERIHIVGVQPGTLSNITPIKADRFYQARKLIRRPRPSSGPRATQQTHNPVIITRTHPGQQIFEHTFNIEQVPSGGTRRFRVKPRRLISNTPILQHKQRGTTLDLRGSTKPNESGLYVNPVLPKAADQLLTSNGISLARGHQKQQPTAMPRTLAPPLNPGGALKVITPEQSTLRVSRQSEWDIIREELLRFKRQHREMFRSKLHKQPKQPKQAKQQQKQQRVAASGVRMLSEEPVDRFNKVDLHSSHSGETARRSSSNKEISANKDLEPVTVDVDRSRRTIDRDVRVFV